MLRMFSEQFTSSESKEHDALCDVKNESRSATVNDKERTANFYSWREHYPELKLLQDNIDIIIEESKSIPNVSIIHQIHRNLMGSSR